MRVASLALIAIAIGCSSDMVEVQPEPYSVSGVVVDAEGQGVPGVSLDFGTFGTAASGLDGSWSKSQLQGTVTITPSKGGWGFDPGSLEVTEARSSANFSGAPVRTLFEIVVDWQNIGQGSAAAVAAMTAFATAEGEPTHFGTRLEYPADNAFFAQALSREEAEEYGLITIEVPAAEETSLFVTAVHLTEEGEGQSGQRDPIIWFGHIRGLEIVEGESTAVDMEDITWVAPDWEFEDPAVEDAYVSGTMVGHKDASHLEFYITVTDPFGDRSWDDFIGLNGIGGAVAESDGAAWRVQVQCPNDLVGQEHQSTCSFWPYLHSEKFNLPDVRFSVPPLTAQFVVDWK